MTSEPQDSARSIQVSPDDLGSEPASKADAVSTVSARPKFIRQTELIERVAAYDPTLDEAMLNRAYVFAMRMHGAQLRASGDPYFAHPIEVAAILTDYRLDAATICSALLHDVIEDTPVTREEIASRFDEEIAGLVEGVTKLTRLEVQSEYTKQSENLRKFMLAISKDIRVLLIKLADRLHNMRTLHFMPDHKRERISRETLDVYAPLARSIGCNRFATELEDLAFGFINPVGRNAISQRLKGIRETRGDTIERVKTEIEEVLGANGIRARVLGREKSPYSIWKKLQRKSIAFAQLSDIFAFRVCVENDQDCYRALGVIHTTWPCVPERFKDFISTPKNNNYQSLHTTIIGFKGTRIEMQIRTDHMDRVAEEGVAAHWGYKNATYGFDEEAATLVRGRNPINSLRNIIAIVENGSESDEWVEHAKMEMYLDQVFCFTPKGRLISLPNGAMPLDFAFAVHTEVGETAIGCKINGEHRPLHTVLQNGDQVEIIRGLASKVSHDWPNLTMTGRARAAIRRHIRQTEKGDFIKLGRQIIDRGARQFEKSLIDISLRPALERFNISSEEELFELCGRNKIPPNKLLETLFPGLKLPSFMQSDNRVRIKTGQNVQTYITGTGLKPDVPIKLGACCTPVPGDRIIGIAQSDEVVVHAVDCEALVAFEAKDTAYDWINLGWSLIAEKNSLTMGRLSASMQNKPGALGAACILIGDAKGNIINIHIGENQHDFLTVAFDIEVFDAKHMTNIVAALRTSPTVDSVERIRG